MGTNKVLMVFQCLIAGFIAYLFGCAFPSTADKAGQSLSSQHISLIDSIKVLECQEGAVVTIAADSPFTFSSVRQPHPLAVVLYFPESTAESAQVSREGGNSWILQILTRQVNGGRTARIELQLAADGQYTALQMGNAVQVTIMKRDSTETTASSQALAANAAAPLPPGTPEGSVFQLPREVSSGAASTRTGKVDWGNRDETLSVDGEAGSGTPEAVSRNMAALDEVIYAPTPRKVCGRPERSFGALTK